jgi:hypothetical protein
MNSLINGICDEKVCKTIDILNGSCIDDLSCISIIISGGFNRAIQLLITAGISNFGFDTMKDYIPEFYMTKELSDLIIEQGMLKSIGCFQIFDHGKVHNAYIFYNKLLDDEYKQAYSLMNQLSKTSQSTVHVQDASGFYDELNGEIKFTIPYESTMMESNKHYKELIDNHITIKI